MTYYDCPWPKQPSTRTTLLKQFEAWVQTLGGEMIDRPYFPLDRIEKHEIFLECRY